MVKLLRLILRLTRDVHAELLKKLLIHVGENDGGVRLTAAQGVYLVDGVAAMGFVTAQMARAMSSSSMCRRGCGCPYALDLEMLDRLDNAGRDEQHLLVDSGERL